MSDLLGEVLGGIGLTSPEGRRSGSAGSSRNPHERAACSASTCCNRNGMSIRCRALEHGRYSLTGCTRSPLQAPDQSPSSILGRLRLSVGEVGRTSGDEHSAGRWCVYACTRRTTQPPRCSEAVGTTSQPGAAAASPATAARTARSPDRRSMARRRIASWRPWNQRSKCGRDPAPSTSAASSKAPAMMGHSAATERHEGWQLALSSIPPLGRGTTGTLERYSIYVAPNRSVSRVSSNGTVHRYSRSKRVSIKISPSPCSASNATPRLMRTLPRSIG